MRKYRSLPPLFPRPLFVVGMHRSGTTMVTRALHDAGVFSGAKLDHNQEPLFAIDINEHLLNQAGGSWWQPPDWASLEPVLATGHNSMKARHILKSHGDKQGWPSQVARFCYSHPWVLKDPRLCFTLPWWVDRFPRARVLWVQRNPEPIVNSLLRRQADTGEVDSELTPKTALDLVHKYDAAAVRSVKSTSVPFFSIHYEALTSSDSDEQEAAWTSVYEYAGAKIGRTSGYAPRARKGESPQNKTEEQVLGKSATDGPLVSVIVPNYNHAPYLDERIGSIVNQTYKNIEILLMDDCSPDNSRDVLTSWAKKDARIELKFNQTNSGSPFHQWKLGAEWAKGKYLWIAESDDVAELDMLATHVEALETNEKAVIAFSQSQIIDGRGRYVDSWNVNYERIFGSALRWSRRFTVSGKAEVADRMVLTNTIPNASGALFRKSAFDKAGIPETSWKLNGDWLFYSRIMQMGDVEYFPEERNKFRHHDQTQRLRSIQSSDTFFELLSLFDVYEAEGWADQKLLLAARRQVSEWWMYFVLYMPPNARNVADTLRLFFKFAKYNPKIITDRDLLRSIRKAMTRTVRIWLKQA